MKERILLVGEDPLLLATRALLLSDWETETANSYEAMQRIYAGATYDLVLIGHTVPALGAHLLIDRLKEQDSPPEILVIRLAMGEEGLEVETHLSDLYESPAWLRNRVSEMLMSRRGDGDSPERSTSRNVTNLVV